jgi:hypothetical protein
MATFELETVEQRIVTAMQFVSEMKRLTSP